MVPYCIARDGYMSHEWISPRVCLNHWSEPFETCTSVIFFFIQVQKQVSMLRRKPTRIELKLDDLEEYENMKKEKEAERRAQLSAATQTPGQESFEDAKFCQCHCRKTNFYHARGTVMCTILREREFVPSAEHCCFEICFCFRKSD